MSLFSGSLVSWMSSVIRFSFQWDKKVFWLFFCDGLAELFWPEWGVALFSGGMVFGCFQFKWCSARSDFCWWGSSLKPAWFPRAGDYWSSCSIRGILLPNFDGIAQIGFGPKESTKYYLSHIQNTSAASTFRVVEMVEFRSIEIGISRCLNKPAVHQRFWLHFGY